MGDRQLQEEFEPFGPVGEWAPNPSFKAPDPEQNRFSEPNTGQKISHEVCYNA
jgi:hypothetical protein